MGCGSSTSMEIVVFLGSLRKQSCNRGLIEDLINSDEMKDLNLRISMPDLGDIPFFNEDLQKQKKIPSSVEKLKKLVHTADLLIFVTPEYNGALSASVKNAFDWTTRPDPKYGEKCVVYGKRAGVISTSYLSQNQVKDCEKMGEYPKVSFYDKAFYINLGQKANDQNGKVVKEDVHRDLLKWGGDIVKWAQPNK